MTRNNTIAALGKFHESILKSAILQKHITEKELEAIISAENHLTMQEAIDAGLKEQIEDLLRNAEIMQERYKHALKSELYLCRKETVKEFTKFLKRNSVKAISADCLERLAELYLEEALKSKEL